jgi:hypothetical protein
MPKASDKREPVKASATETLEVWSLPLLLALALGVVAFLGYLNSDWHNRATPPRTYVATAQQAPQAEPAVVTE